MVIEWATKSNTYTQIQAFGTKLAKCSDGYEQIPLVRRTLKKFTLYKMYQKTTDIRKRDKVCKDTFYKILEQGTISNARQIRCQDPVKREKG